MYTRFQSFAQAVRSSRQWTRFGSTAQRSQIPRFICQSCRYKFSSSTVLHRITQASRRTFATATKNGKQKGYPTELLIYDAGDTRTTYVAFWKAVVLLQFGTCFVFITPLLYKNPNQPNEYIRFAQAVGVTIASAIPCALLSFITAPYVSQVHMQIPPTATRSLTALRAFARNPPGTTKIRFLTLRIFPIGKFTTCTLNELRALPPRRFRMANLQRLKSKSYHEEQKKKAWQQKLWQLVNEPRWKFYVKEGTSFTVRTGVPGVWESIAASIKEQTDREMEKKGQKMIGVRKAMIKERAGAVMPATIKRQTLRPRPMR
ncbi:hypothetical protein DM02DRAFT_560015 [Periconia macrospinosa]|uniref:Uncharacterized protein n=1 Tax=Periconia macrospinosa TaxID=97972 RepID=A0A2V1DYF3_9PLEO|nr:hypothetical protein DM02DRAFT_560015 [Periconia macrospinosa]